MYIYNNKFYFLGMLNVDDFKVKLNKSILSINIVSRDCTQLPILKVSHYVNNNRVNKISKKINSFLNSWDSYYFSKIKFKGKVYKISKYRYNNLKLSFGRCHKNMMVVRSLFLKKRKKVKTKCMLFGTSKYDLDFSKSLITNVRPINMFTQRGLRLARQIVYRKIGKKSSYTTK
jgi:ribosomal protein L6P/L9E